MIVLSPDVFSVLFTCSAFGPLVLLVCLFFPRPAAKRLLMASGIFFLPVALLTTLTWLNGWRTDPPTGSGGLLFVVVGFWVVAVSSLLSLVCGAFCFRRYPWSAVWLVPAAVVLVWVSAPVLRVFL